MWTNRVSINLPNTLVQRLSPGPFCPVLTLKPLEYNYLCVDIANPGHSVEEQINENQIVEKDTAVNTHLASMNVRLRICEHCALPEKLEAK